MPSYAVVGYLRSRPRLVFKFDHQQADHIDTYADTDWAGCPRSRRSTSGGCIMVGSHLLKCWSSTQAGVAMSSGEAEFYGVVKGAIAGLGALADCWGGNSHSLYNESMSILPVEFARNEATATTVALPGRFYVGQNVERLQTSAMVTGVSSLNTAINLRMDIPTATTLGHQVSLICLYDSILTIDLMSKQASVRV